MTDDEKRRWKGPSEKRGTSGRRMGERKIIAHRAKNESSKRWIERQLQDPYVQKAKSEGYRARAAYKLLEIDEKLNLFRRGQRVVDLGCAPGGWLQVAQIKGASEIAGIDLLPVEPLAGVHIVQGDINNPDDVAELLKGLTGAPDLVLSDMAANTTGHKQPTICARSHSWKWQQPSPWSISHRAAASVQRFSRVVRRRKCWIF
jgi:23S rRNA (uridine2552-2'-O)-methyltransferase